MKRATKKQGKVTPDSIGVPRTLAFHELRVFFDLLLAAHGLAPVYSPPSGPEILELGLERSIDEVCFPLKMFFGHVAALEGMGLDAVFVPRLISLAVDRNLCPKFHVLPDLIAPSFQGLDVLSPTLDLHHTSSTSLKAHLFEACRHMLVERGRWTGDSASHLEVAWAAENAPAPQGEDTGCGDVTIALLGHHYAERDAFLSLSTRRWLRQQGARIVHTPRQLTDAPVLWEKGIYYEPSVRTARAIDHWLNTGVDGIVLLTFFACGPDSYATDTFFYRLKAAGIRLPLLRLIFDEHTSVEGLVTRLSTFADVVRDQKQRRSGNSC